MHDVENELDQFRVGNSYETVEFLGYGSTGVIYRGRNIILDTPVAIKILNPELSKNDQFMQFLNTEIKSVFKLNHQNIVNVKETGKENDKFYIIMEFVEGESLEKILKEKGKPSLQESVEFLQQLALAIEYANANGVIHKAIKPENILISHDNHLKLTGFGLSKAMATAWITITASSAANVEYMSPEQAEGEDIDHRCDIYSFGIIAYELLTGEVPFKKEGTSILNLAMKHINTMPDPPKLKNPAIPHWLDNIVMKCIEKKPANRYQCGKDIFDALVNQEPTNRTPIPQTITSDALRNSFSGKEKPEIEDVLQNYFDNREEVSFQKDRADPGLIEVPLAGPESKGNATEYFNLRNQKQLKLLLLVVILLELVIISIFVFIIFSG
jgi:serine/threonine protein kinase